MISQPPRKTQLMISFRLLMYSCFFPSFISLGGKCLVCQSNDFWERYLQACMGMPKVEREALEQCVNLIRFSHLGRRFRPHLQPWTSLWEPFVFLQWTKPQTKEIICLGPSCQLLRLLYVPLQPLTVYGIYGQQRGPEVLHGQVSDSVSRVCVLALLS